MPVIFVLFSVLAAAGVATAVLRLRNGHAARSVRGERAEHFIGSGTREPGAPEVGSRVRWPLVRLDISVPSGLLIGPTSRTGGG